MYNKISIIIPCHKPKEKLLERTIQSIEKQTYKNHETIICSDHNSKEEFDIIKKVMHKSNIQIKCVKNKNECGISNARNEAVKYSSANWLVWLDDDDTLSEDCLEKLMFCSLDTGAEYVIGNCVVIQNSISKIKNSSKYFILHKEYKSTEYDPFMLNIFSIQPQLLNKKKFNEMGGFNPYFKKAELSEFFLRYISIYGSDLVTFDCDAEYNYDRSKPMSVSSNREELFRYRKKALLMYRDNCRISVDDILYLGRNKLDDMQMYVPVRNDSILLPPYFGSLQNIETKINLQ
ncbi:TPA: glycosyltransferase family 2 protein [Clostridioides difficile]|uniref:glycosyltransferase family 2 protein n=5 Tax=Clostridioides difficile TaxID=1496 RepID=UPI00038CB2CD|nr:glycosyltransferase family 2 protein [Clostridioides difficile]EJA6850667.1 glycosyltransferase family 2 protein [Clostridioides difficile]ELX4591765.1 glycosyltransferase family 2 protein [Clostridioides difficile]EQE69354.1 glycosyl transferase 2 family protein [Clostridioides difficile CD45]MBG0257349.1 glycosyltransferase family 2 protein [Clostridioides difficile]MBH7527371.1 glycosyltransferase family 2 protein [Clostridioides difficile]